MDRKRFLKKIAVGTGTLLSSPAILSAGFLWTPASEQKSGLIRFGVITDVHQDFFPEAEKRLQQFIHTANQEDLDFIIQLGDFTYPLEKNRGFLGIWNEYKGPKFHVLGNHDMDRDGKEAFLRFVGENPQKKYYSFDRNGFHFIVLDTNFIRDNGLDIPYERANYKKYKAPQIGCVSKEQVEWLKNDLAKAELPAIIFSHQPFNGSAGNSEEIINIIKEANNERKKVIASFSGHLHSNWHLEIDKVHHVQLNSSSYFWVGKKFPMVPGRYPEAVEKEYPLLPQMAPYDDSLFAIVEIDDPRKVLNITGRNAGFVKPSPYELGYYTKKNQMSPSSAIQSRVLIY